MSNVTPAPRALLEAVRYFADADLALAFIVDLRWPNGPVCPHCAATDPGFLRTRRIWKCRNAECRKQFSVKVGTIFEDSPLGLDKWLPALWMLANAKNGISSHELARALGITQKSAWFMLHRVRLAMRTMTFERMTGEVEADETYIGGKRANMHKKRQAKIRPGSAKHMQAVLGMLERKAGEKHSRVRLAHLQTTRRNEMEPTIRENVAEGSALYTDAHPTYRRMAQLEFGDSYMHAAVDHAVSYVDGRVHTNGLENFWSLLKRTIRGTYVSVDPVHLFRYLDEQAFRFNARKGNDLSRFVDVLRDVVGRRLTYKALISAGMEPART